MNTERRDRVIVSTVGGGINGISVDFSRLLKDMEEYGMADGDFFRKPTKADKLVRKLNE